MRDLKGLCNLIHRKWRAPNKNKAPSGYKLRAVSFHSGVKLSGNNHLRAVEYRPLHFHLLNAWAYATPQILIHHHYTGSHYYPHNTVTSWHQLQRVKNNMWRSNSNTGHTCHVPIWAFYYNIYMSLNICRGCLTDNQCTYYYLHLLEHATESCQRMFPWFWKWYETNYG